MMQRISDEVCIGNATYFQRRKAEKRRDAYEKHYCVSIVSVCLSILSSNELFSVLQMRLV